MDGLSPRLHQAQEEEKYLCRMRKHLPDKFRDMCNMHLAFILNLSDDKLEAILDSEPSTNRKRITLAPIFRKKVKTGSCLFGAPLTNQSICLMTPLIKFLSLKENISKEGLFRKPGNRQRMRNLREALIAKGPSVEIDTAVFNPYDVAGVLKEFLRDLPEPLLSDKHMEAHRQINGLGKCARTPEDLVRYSVKKLSALQLLMQLLPSPFCRMTKEVLTLLHAVSKTPETKMTPNTLATIFAPIFFLDRKVSALDVCDAVKEAEPALTFMIENSEKLFKVPKELSVDIINYWKEMESSPHVKAPEPNSKLSQSYKIRKSVSGRTLNTAICYIDREQCKNVDIASNTQAELDNLFAHVQSLPDTPGNQRIKDLMARRSRTPVSSGRRHTRSKSIGASIRKMVPSLSKSKAKSLDMTGHSTPYRDIKVNSSALSDVMKCPASALSTTTAIIAQSITTCSNSSLSSPRTRTPNTRKRVSSDNLSSMDHCTPPKQDYKISKRHDSTCDISQCSMTPTSILSNDFLYNSIASDSILLPTSTHKSPERKLEKGSTQSTSSSFLRVATPQEIKENVTSPQMIGESEKEISYLDCIPHNERSSINLSAKEGMRSPLCSPLHRRPLRPCNAPGTPIMPRAVLQISRYTFETSL